MKKQEDFKKQQTQNEFAAKAEKNYLETKITTLENQLQTLQ